MIYLGRMLPRPITEGSPRFGYGSPWLGPSVKAIRFKRLSGDLARYFADTWKSTNRLGDTCSASSRFCLRVLFGLAIGFASFNNLAEGVLRAEVIIAYDAMNSVTGAAATEAFPDLIPLKLSRGDGLGAASGGTYNSSGWTTDLTDYLAWGWQSSLPLDLTDLDLRYDRSSSGPTEIEILLAINGQDFRSIYLDSNVLLAGEDVWDIDLSDFTNVSSAEFRLLGSGATSASGTFDIEPLTSMIPDRGIVVNGVKSVPEPSSLCLLATVGFPALYVMHRSRKRLTPQSLPRAV